jgi:hypothetical protein
MDDVVVVAGVYINVQCEILLDKNGGGLEDLVVVEEEARCHSRHV